LGRTDHTTKKKNTHSRQNLAKGGESTQECRRATYAKKYVGTWYTRIGTAKDLNYERYGKENLKKKKVSEPGIRGKESL